MKHLKPFNESKENLIEELKEFCSWNSLAYLYDEGFTISITSRDKVKYPDKQHILVTLGLKGQEPNPWEQYYWDDVKDYFIPFLQRLTRRYELLDYFHKKTLPRGLWRWDPAGYLAFNTEKGVFYLPLEQVINDEVSQVFNCLIWGINLKILGKK